MTGLWSIEKEVMVSVCDINKNQVMVSVWGMEGTDAAE